MAQRVGDYDDPGWSIKTIAFTVPANPMSDRVQLVIEVYETENIPYRENLQQRGQRMGLP